VSAPAATAGRAAQVQASNPRASVFVTANAGSGKTSTLVTRVTRLLLAGAPPEAILCVTFTKAAATEMQRRLFKQLGDWAVMDNADLTKALANIDEAGRDLRRARALFARALETPGGLKIQTIHAFCEKLLRRFPLEAGVPPGFKVLEDAAAAEVAREARRRLAELAFGADHAVAEAYAHFSIGLAAGDFDKLLDDLAAKGAAIETYADACLTAGRSVDADVWRRCGFERRASVAEIEQAALKRTQTIKWRRMADAIAACAKPSEATVGMQLQAAASADSLGELSAIFLTGKGEARKVIDKLSVAPAVLEQLHDERARLFEALERIAAAGVAEDTVRALKLAMAYTSLYRAAKDARGALDFADLISAALELLTRRADAAWVLYKLDGGLEHVLLDEAQDTAAEQWGILHALTAEFFHGEGVRAGGRTLFAVGDPKQSIFSFQGAAPERLALEEGAFAETAAAAQQRFWRVPLLESWRSAPEVLSLVDQVFADADALAGLRPAGDNVAAFELRHNAIRGPGGGVDLWPLETWDASEADDDPWDPLDKEPAGSANRKLAERIALAVAEMVARGDAVVDRETGAARACRFGDVLILVRWRGPIFNETIRALKRRGVPVAGADRLKLSEHGAFKDLMALGQFARFPADDLSLAVLLRGPFCDLDEESLFDLAHGRPGTLWGELQSRAGERREWAEAARFLGWAVGAAVSAAPFDFYCQALGRIDGEGRSMRQRTLTRLGAEAEQALDVFVGQTLVAESAGLADLERLLAWMGALDLDIKREQEAAGGGEVRVMTVHGAKGLEAPIVIFPDTMGVPKMLSNALIGDGHGGFIWAPSSDADCAATREAKAALGLAGRHERLRLLYVALTRARDRLIVCGVSPKRQTTQAAEPWYDWVARAFARAEARPFPLPGGGEGQRIGSDPATAAPLEAPVSGASLLPTWTAGLAPADPPRPRVTSPSRLEREDTEPSPSPLAEVRGLGRWRRGEIIHRLLQLLPDLPPDARREAATRLLAREPGLTPDQRDEVSAAALGVLEDARFAPVFGPGSRAEVAVVGGAASLPANLKISGRVDRLVVEAERVLVADFKTNRPAPARIEDADPAYIRQMALYAAVLAEVFPGRRIEAALVWTDGPALMPIPAERLSAALAALRP